MDPGICGLVVDFSVVDVTRKRVVVSDFDSFVDCRVLPDVDISISGFLGTWLLRAVVLNGVAWVITDLFVAAVVVVVVLLIKWVVYPEVGISLLELVMFGIVVSSIPVSTVVAVVEVVTSFDVSTSLGAGVSVVLGFAVELAVRVAVELAVHVAVEPVDLTVVVEPVDLTFVVEPVDLTVVVEPVDLTGVRIEFVLFSGVGEVSAVLNEEVVLSKFISVDACLKTDEWICWFLLVVVVLIVFGVVFAVFVVESCTLIVVDVDDDVDDGVDDGVFGDDDNNSDGVDVDGVGEVVELVSDCKSNTS